MNPFSIFVIFYANAFLMEMLEKWKEPGLSWTALILVIFLQAPVCPGQRATGGQQDDGIPQRDAACTHSLDGRCIRSPANRVALTRQRKNWPNIFKAFPQHVGFTQLTFTAEVRQGDLPEIVQATKEGQKEEYLGGDEPEHALSERDRYLGPVITLQVFVDHIAEPTVEQVENPQQTHDPDQRTDAESIDVQDKPQQQCKNTAGSDDWPSTGFWNVIGFVTSHVYPLFIYAHFMRSNSKSWNDRCS